jgi:hypothetical protein
MNEIENSKFIETYNQTEIWQRVTVTHNKERKKETYIMKERMDTVTAT